MILGFLYGLNAEALYRGLGAVAVGVGIFCSLERTIRERREYRERRDQAAAQNARRNERAPAPRPGIWESLPRVKPRAEAKPDEAA